MNYEAAQEIIACLPQGRTLFHYFPDRYAIVLLSRYLGEGKPIAEVKASPYAKLLNRPVLKEILSRKGDGLLLPEDLGASWPPRPECYLLTLGTWGPEKRHEWNRYYFQTSRPGMNLVLQLNFSSLHNDAYRALIRPEHAHPFQTAVHPIARKGFHTLAWARLDIDLSTGEALIEEVQTDWLRFAAGARRRVEDIVENREAREAVATIYFNGEEIDPRAMRAYFDNVLGTHIPVWDEALLTAVLDFLLDEIGITRIYMHQFDSGCRMKGISGNLPPRSLYTKLPARFCFSKVSAPPEFLMAKPTRTLKTLLRADAARFWKLEF